MLYPRKPLLLPNLFVSVKNSRFFVYIHTWIRFLFFMLVRGGKISQFPVSGNTQLSHVLFHNLKENFGLMTFNRGRIETLLYPLFTISDVRRNASKIKVLSIGPKNEGELLLLSNMGIRWNNIIGADLFSYSPKIKVMDMHNMDFPDNSFDVVISSWVLRYSANLEKAVNEMIRVAKNRSFMAIGFTWSGDKGSIYGGNRFDGGIDELLGFFKGHVDYVYWREEDVKDDISNMTVVFRLKK